MPATITTDLIVPEILQTEVNVDFAKRFDFQFQGAATRMAVGAGELVNIRGFEELSGDADRMVDGGSYDTNAASTYKDIGVVLHRVKKFGAEDLGMIVSGMDATAAIRRMISQFYVKEVANRFVNVLSAVFGTAGPLVTANRHDIYVDTATAGDRKKLDPDAAAAGMAKIGDNMNDLGVWFMHSAVYAYLLGQKYLTSVTNTDAFTGEGIVQTYMGRPIMVVDHADMVQAGTNCTEYFTYLVGRGSMVLGVQKDINPELFRESNKVDILSTDFHFVPHLRGCYWSGSANPTNAALATPTNWALAYADAKQVRAVRFDHNIA